jgi:hypothetical protein
MNRLFAGLLVGFMLLGADANLYQTTRSPEIKRAYSDSTWEVFKSNGIANPYTVGTDSIVESGNTGWLANFLVNRTDTVYGDYKISATIQGTESLPNKKEMHGGFVPWYIDDNNYVLCYMRWSNTDKPNYMSEVEVTGRIDGNFMVMWKSDQFMVSEWNDMWTDGRSQADKEACTFTVEKKRTENNDADYIKAYINDELIGFHMCRDTVKYAGRKAHYGVYGYNDTFTFTNISITNENNDKLYAPLGDGMAEGQTGAWAYDDTAKSYTLTDTAGTSWQSNKLTFENNTGSDNYQIGANVTLTAGSDSQIGILIYYKDEYDYLAAVIKAASGKATVGFQGKFTTIVQSNMTVTPVDSMADSTLDLSTITSVKATKNGTNFKLFVNDNEVAGYANANCTGRGGIGFGGSMVTLTAKDLNVALIPYNPYDWYTSDLGTATTYYVSAKTDTGAVTYESKTFTFADAGITAGDDTKITSLYYLTSYYGNLTSKATFSNIKADSVYGLYGWIEDGEHYLRVLVTPKGIVAVSHFGTAVTTQTYDLPSGAAYASGNKTLIVRIDGSDVHITWYGIEVTSSAPFTISGNNTEVSPGAGLACACEGISVTNYTVNGFSPYSEIANGDWKFYGARPNSWTLKDDGSIVSSFVGGTNWKSTLALHPIEDKKDYYFASTVNVSAHQNSDFKTGFMPYYLDASNYVFIWISQFTGASPYLVVSCMLNGELVGYEWRQTAFTISYMNTDVQLEAGIKGDVVSVYINKSYVPYFSTTFEGLSNRTTAGAYAGFNSVNTSATYSNYTLCSDDRIYKMTEKPTITETGTRKTSGTVGTKIVLPVYTGTNSNDDTLTPTIAVIDPNGAAVELTSNRFVPEMEGTYTVTVTCEDNWGNQADPLTYTILVAKAGTASSDTSNTSASSETSQTSETGQGGNQMNKGAIIGGSVAGGVVVVGGVGALVYFLIKKKKHI